MKKKALIFLLVSSLVCVYAEAPEIEKVTLPAGTLSEGVGFEVSEGKEGKVVDITYRYNKSLIKHLLYRGTGIVVGGGIFYLGFMIFNDANRMGWPLLTGTSGIVTVGSGYILCKNLYCLFKDFGGWEKRSWATLTTDGITFHDLKKSFLWKEIIRFSFEKKEEILVITSSCGDVFIKQEDSPLPLTILYENIKNYVPGLVDKKISD